MLNSWATDYDDDTEPWTPCTPVEEATFFLIVALFCLPWVAALAWVIRHFGG